MSERLVLGGIIVVFLVLSGAPLGAQNGEPGQTPAKPSELDTMVVTADRMPEKLRQVSQNVTVITSEDIKKSGAKDVMDLLKKTGIQTFSDGAEGYGNEGVVIRGGKTSMHGFDLAGDILVLVDGHRTASDFFTGIDLGNTERIEIIRGPGAVQYGAAAMGGVINVITKRGGEKTEARVEAGFGSWGERRVQASASGRSGRLDIAASASYFTRDEYNIGGSGGQLGNSDLDYRTRYNLNLGWNFDDFNRVGLIFQGSKTEDAGKGISETSTSASTGYRDTRQSRDNYSFDLSYEGRTEDGARTWMGRYFQGDIEYDLTRFYLPAAHHGRRNFSSSENKFKGAQGQFGWDLGRAQFVTGVDWLSYDFYQEQKVANPTWADSDFTNVGAFLLAKIHLLENKNLTLSGGIRYDDFDVNIKAEGVNSKPRDVKTSVDNWAPALGLAYSPVDILKFRANYAKAFKMPTPRQLGGYTYMATTPFVGNPDLKPEKSANWDVGFDADYKAFFFSATYFHSKYKDMISYETIPGGDPNYNNGGRYYWYINLNNATFDGLELGARFDLGEHFDWGLTLEPYLNWTRLFTYEDGDGLKLDGRARDSLAYGALFDHDGLGLTINLDATYYGRQKTTVSRVQRDLMGGCTVWDLKLSKRLYDFGEYGDISAKVAVRNMFNKKYATDIDDWMPGGSVYLGLAYSY